MDSKYFTPDIEDIRVGYECRVVNTYFLASEWEQEHTLSPLKVLTRKDIETLFKTSWQVRVPYLTQEQIRREGWVVREAPQASGQLVGQQKFEYFFEKGNVMGGLRTEGRVEFILKDVLLDDVTESSSNGRLYLGECKDINTFRYICKLLGI